MPFPPNKPSGPSGPPGSSFPRKIIRTRLPETNQSKDEHRINERIRVPEVRLIDENGGQVGIVRTIDALQMARSKGLDLMEVAPNAKPPVCKICDYGKFKYEKKKKDQAAKKKQTVVKVKEVQLRPTTDTHDIDFKVRNIISFLNDGDKARITITFRGREISHIDLGRKMLDEILLKLKDYGLPESNPQIEGKKMIVVLAPVPKKKAATG